MVDVGESDNESLIEIYLGEAASESVIDFTNRDSWRDNESTSNSFTSAEEGSGKNNTVEDESDKSIAEEKMKTKNILAKMNLK